MAKRHNLLINLQIARFVAAAVVVIYHTQHEIVDAKVGAWRSFVPFEGLFLGIGVDIFFIISGFMMVLIAADEYGKPGAVIAFLRKRIVRVVPLYWIFSTLMLVAMLMFANRVTQTTIDPIHVVSSYFFFPYAGPTGKTHPILGVGWTLNYEMFFYAVFAMSLLLPQRLGLAAVAGSLVALVSFVNLYPGELPTQFTFWGHSIVLEFLFGCGVGLAFRNGIRLSVVPAIFMLLTAVPLLAVATVFGWTSSTLRFIGAGIPALLIVLPAALAPQFPDSRGVRGLRLAGDASYVLYLSHPFMINMVAILWNKFHLGSTMGFVLACFAATVTVSIVLHLFLERPLLAALNRQPSNINSLCTAKSCASRVESS